MMLNRLLQGLEESRTEESGFTLIELLVVIAILGILAAIVVFSVAGISDRGQLSACKTDTSTIQTAEEANFAENSSYAAVPQLQANGFLSNTSSLHSVVLIPANPSATPPTRATYNVVEDSTATPPNNTICDGPSAPGPATPGSTVVDNINYF